MKSFKRYVHQNKENNSSVLENSVSDDESIDEGFVSAAVISSKLASMKKQVANEDDIQKQLALIARMIYFGIGTIALVTNNRRKRV